MSQVRLLTKQNSFNTNRQIELAKAWTRKMWSHSHPTIKRKTESSHKYSPLIQLCQPHKICSPKFLYLKNQMTGKHWQWDRRYKVRNWSKSQEISSITQIPKHKSKKNPVRLESWDNDSINIEATNKVPETPYTKESSHSKHHPKNELIPPPRQSQP